MKKNSLLLFITFCASTASFCQNHSFGIKTGIVDVDMVGDYGLNLEFFYERKLIKGLFLGLNVGIANQNNFPSFFDPRIERVNNVPPKVNDYILTLSDTEAMFLMWQSHSIDYTQLYLRHQLPIRLFSCNLNVYSGGMIQRSHHNGFFLKEFSSVNGRVSDFTPKYEYSTDTVIGWMLGFGLSKPLPKGYKFELDAKYNLPSSDEMIFTFGVLRVGLSKTF